MSKTIFDKEITGVIKILKKVFDELDISAYLIGAQARDVWFSSQSTRSTQDVDWVIAHSDENIFKGLQKKLINEYKFSTTNNPLKFKSPNGIEVDLIPFDYIDIPHFIGLNEVFERGIEKVTFDDEELYNIASLPSIVLLKLIAWNDNPENRSKDIEDINFILKHFDIYTDDCFELFTEIEPELISARVIGRKIGYIIGNSIELKQRLIEIIKNQISQPHKSPMIRLMLSKSEKTELFIINQLQEVLKGINESDAL